jgi:hypothetical protein
MKTNRPLLLIVDGHRKEAFYAGLPEALERQLDGECRFVSPPGLLADDLRADLVLLDDESWPHIGAALPELRRRGIPSLHLVDGIVEWRNTWENPCLTGPAPRMPLFQPVLADKVACLGPAQARLLESWGNAGKCEVTGSPRLDLVPRCSALRRRRGAAPNRILVATARCPGFTAGQQEQTTAALRDVRAWFESAGPACEPVWRVAPEMEAVADGANTFGEVSLVEQLQAVDALITTPSTLQIEAMLAGVPVVLLDYSNRPHYLPAAWSITAPRHVAEILPLLAEPATQRLLYQDFLLQDHVASGPSVPRVVRLAEVMVETGRACRAAGAPLDFPPRIVGDSPATVRRIPGPDLAELHPDHPEFADADLPVLQAELGHLRRALKMGFGHAVYRALCQWEARRAQSRKRTRS